MGPGLNSNTAFLVVVRRAEWRAKVTYGFRAHHAILPVPCGRSVMSFPQMCSGGGVQATLGSSIWLEEMNPLGREAEEAPSRPEAMNPNKAMKTQADEPQANGTPQEHMPLPQKDLTLQALALEPIRCEQRTLLETYVAVIRLPLDPGGSSSK